jgi:alkylation response protein AidB-like acyl-CoA dehydrogenase
MDFDLTASQQMTQRSVREFVRKEVAPLSQEVDENDNFPIGVYTKALDLEVLDITVPEALGGIGDDYLSFVIALEEFACGSAALAHGIAATEAIVYLLSAYGSKQQQDMYLPRLLAGKSFGAAAIWQLEAAAGPGRALPSANGYRLNGRLDYVPFAPVADLAIVFATEEDDSVSAFILGKQMPGVTASASDALMGMRGFPLGRLELKDVPVSKDHLLGSTRMGREIFDDLCRRSETAVSAIAVGLCQAALEAAAIHSKARIQFGTPLAEMEATQNKIADMTAGIQSARLLVYKAACSLENAKLAVPQTAMAKITASQLAVEICREAVQIHGGYGYIKDYPVERYYRDALFSLLYPTANEIKRRSVARYTLRKIR